MKTLAATAGAGSPRRMGCPQTAICLGLAMAILAVYWSLAGHDYVNYDDGPYVSANPHVQGGLTWESLKWAFTTGHASDWHPLTWMSHMLDWQLFGNRPGAFHVVSLGFHLISAILLFLGLRRWTGALWRSAFVASLFALHPLRVESVAWIAERKDVLSTSFFLLTLLAYGEYARVSMTGSQGLGVPRVTFQVSRFKTFSWYGLALVFLALGLLSKPMLVTTPFVLLLLDYWPFRRLGSGDVVTAGAIGGARLAESGSDGTKPKAGYAALLLVLEKVPFFLLAVASSILTFFVQREGRALSMKLTLGERVSNALVSYGRYLSKTFFPQRLAVPYPHPGHWPVWLAALNAVLLLAVTGWVIASGRRRPYLFVGWFWFLGTLVPVIGLVQAGYQSMADRFTYVPHIGLFVMLAWGIVELVPARPWRAPVLGAAAGAALLACAGLTATQVRFWTDSGALFAHAVQVTEKNFLAYNNLGAYLSGKGRVDAAMDCYQKSLEIKPDYEDALNNLGKILAARKQYSEAIAYCEQALRVKPHQPQADDSLESALSELRTLDVANGATIAEYLGNSLLQTRQLDDAITCYRQAVSFQPKAPVFHLDLAKALSQAGRLDEAIAAYRRALALQPDAPGVAGGLGSALLQTGHIEEAVHYLRQAVRAAPDSARAHSNLAVALGRAGRLRDAIAQDRAALSLEPANPITLNNLAWLLAAAAEPSLRDGPRAVSLAEQANRLTGGQTPQVLRTLATAYAEAGRFTDAVATAQQALALPALANAPAYAQSLAAEINLFERQTPFHDSALTNANR